MITLSLALAGCVSASPRAYAPTVRPPPAEPAAFERAFRSCAAEVAAGKRNFTPSGGAIVAGAVGTAAAVPVVGGAVLATTYMSSAGAMLATSALGLIMIVPAMTYSLSSSHRRRNEQEIQEAMAACLAPSGYAVAAWTLIPKGAAAAGPATPTRWSPPAS